MKHRTDPGAEMRTGGEGMTDRVFGLLVVMRDLATAEEIEDCRRIQEARAAAGARPSIDSLLVERGILSPAQVSRLLEYQAESIRVCPECDALVEIENGHGERCPSCETVLEHEAGSTRTSVTGTNHPGGAGPSEAETATRIVGPAGSKPEAGDETATRIPGPGRSKPADAGERAAPAPGTGNGGRKILKAIPVAPGDPEGLVGSVVGGCEISSMLGRGGMGAVYRARRLSLRKTVALKLMPQSFCRSPDAIARFTREARSAGQLRHPNIVQVFNVGEDQGYHYIEMEFVDGRSLREIIEEEGRLPVEELIQVMGSAARALEAAHREGVIHRDIKPDNIMITQSGDLKVTDFGLARGTEDSLEVTREGQVLGTPHYMSPEQCEGKPLDRRSDIYSLGVTFYHMATGRRPFAGDSAVVILRKHLMETAPPPGEIASDLPVGVCTIIERMMEKDVDARYQGMSEVIREIERLQSGEEIEAPPAGARRRREPSRRSGWTLPIGAILTLGLAASVFARSWIQGSTPARPEVRVGIPDRSGRAAPPVDAEPAPPGPQTGGIVVPVEPPAEAIRADDPRKAEAAAPEAETDPAEPAAAPVDPPPSAVDPLGLRLREWWRERGRVVPAGRYVTGTTDGELENGTRSVRLDAFEISEYEVTNGEFRLFVEAGGYERKDLWSEDGWRNVGSYLCGETGSHGPAFWPEGVPPEGEEDHPVVGVSFEEAAAYCAWIASTHPDLEGMRLPTEDEWEVAAAWDKARGEKLYYPWGNDWGAGKANVETGRSARVGSSSFDRSTFGCQDMAGNVREWATGCLPGSEGRPVQRGGCFANTLKPEVFARCESRLAPGDPGFRHRRWDYTGFRIVLPGGTRSGPGCRGDR